MAYQDPNVRRRVYSLFMCNKFNRIFKMNDRIVQFCKELPKIELHAHLNGSLSKETLMTLGCLEKSVSEYQRLSNLYDKSRRSLEECFELFGVAHGATKNKAAVYTATTCVIDEFYRDNCIYLELRTTPRDERDMSKQEYVETVVAAILDNKNDMIVKLLLSIDRRHDLDASNEVLELILRMHAKYPEIIKGVDLCGNPNEGTFPLQIFQKARRGGLKITLHCGEVDNEQEILEMLKFSPDRIGHGTFIRGNSFSMYKEHRIPLEICLTSNIVCGTVVSYEQHHVREWLKEKFPFSISTDDKGVFCSNLSNEYYLASKHFGLNEDDLYAITRNAVDHSFGSEVEKEILGRNIDSWWRKHTSP
ncbi:PREDICTED: adenosine deaminase-like protein [Nicrophorus vespilloides]|uniref:Adenosine deaminase-like protein n=1 Tax=Nicrophorus vespilloides TaxID=110193 RepID=A0ABM1MKX3_NICVS|nr:PREDICTED: adenosine deaminase-like protein [Nicrophorus vespilloides]